MSFRITTIVANGETTIRVEGRIGVDGIDELRRETRLAGERVTLDLSGLTSADGEGLRELLSLAENGARLIGASAYIRQLLEEAS